MPGGVRDVVPFALTVACAGAFAFLSGGYILTRSAPLAIVYLLLAGLWLWFLRSSARPSRLYVSALGVFGLFVAWSGLSVLWSLGPDLTWVAFDLSAFYLVVAAVLGLTPARALQVRVVTVGFLVVVVAVGVYAYLGKVLPDVVTHAHTYARLDSPIGYWNVLALLMVMGLVVALALAGDGRIHPGWRTLAALAAVPLCFAFFFTLSRGGWVALAVALLVYFGLSSTRIASLASLIAVALPVAAVLWRVRHLTTLFQATLDDALRTQQGHVLLGYSLAALAVAAGAQLAIALVQGAVPWPRRLRVAAGAVIIVVLVLGVGGGSARYVQARGGSAWVHARLQAFASDSDQTSSAEGAGRLISLNTGRPPLWREALRQARVDPVAGSGAGTFPFTHYRFRTTGGVVRHAHSEWFNTLSELGVVGLALLRGRAPPVRGGGGAQPVPPPLRPGAAAARGAAGRHRRLPRAHLVGLGLGDGGRRDRVLPLHRDLLRVPVDACRRRRWARGAGGRGGAARGGVAGGRRAACSPSHALAAAGRRHGGHRPARGKLGPAVSRHACRRRSPLRGLSW